MPEIAEVARIVHFLRQHLVGKTISKATAPDDAVLFGKAGTTGPAFEAAAQGKKVVSAGSQGKYFWITFDTAPHVVMHFGMTGWIHIRGVRTAYTNYYNKMKPGEADQWPPRFWKFQLETTETKTSPKVEVAFTDPRRFGRVRVVDCPGDEIRANPPLSENGPDPVVDAEVFTLEFFRDKMRARRVPVKALLLDQTTLSGVGNWVADEVLFQARLHPEQYCNEFSDEEVERLHKEIRTVCQTAVDKLGDSDQFPEHWLFNHRWGKGDKGKSSTLPNGEKLAFITVGGRTSCYAPALQKKTGKVVQGAKEEPLPDDGEEDGPAPVKGGRKTARSKAVKKEESEDEEETESPAKGIKRGPKRKREETEPLPTRGKRRAVKKEETDEEDEGEVVGAAAQPPAKPRRTRASRGGEKGHGEDGEEAGPTSSRKKQAVKEASTADPAPDTTLRRSRRSTRQAR